MCLAPAEEYGGRVESPGSLTLVRVHLSHDDAVVCNVHADRR